MQIALTGQKAAIQAAARAGLFALGLMATLALAACTTVEGTNAMTDFGTFEREVMNSTARGVGLIPGDAPKEDLTMARAPLVLPKSNADLPTPTTQVAAAQLPANSDTVRIDTSNLSEADITMLRNARVVDMRTLGGRPLTEAEARQLTARMQAANMAVTANSDRPLYLPPAEYFTRVGDAQLVCRAPSGELVSLRDERCPADVRKALQARGPNSTVLGTQNAEFTEMETKL
ncbi:hypothetical protein NIM87_15405 [Devosia sp. XJ19-1]|uniref:Pilus assembly protein CpaD n=1 Tax=Devosia ureilytica TaxID=2952754 RepID=A0A9Q4FUI1_9HYPH|nr:hypothetical protein [Devosia ureilytica]MCP8884895.1 hypothetical protein [Devosia ureilytica]MCP8888594.1 hypothetical protein [Devosia ureilytica]